MWYGSPPGKAGGREPARVLHSASFRRRRNAESLLLEVPARRGVPRTALRQDGLTIPRCIQTEFSRENDVTTGRAGPHLAHQCIQHAQVIVCTTLRRLEDTRASLRYVIEPSVGSAHLPRMGGCQWPLGGVFRPW